ncbi:MAG: DEAD/DEAH box helicase family protein [Ignavibacteriaceae bacterium]|nr:DEAD/DEAH box helicase family protein [Ignavibacteriaceae bacterium]
MIGKKDWSERDVITKLIIPSLKDAGWSVEKQIREEVFFTDGRIHVNGSKVKRGERKRADIILYYKPNIPVAIIEVKDNNHSYGAGIQQALNYAQILDIPVAYSTNGDMFLERLRIKSDLKIETTFALSQFPSPAQLWEKYKEYKNITTPRQEEIASQDYFFDFKGRTPRYYQQIAINRTVETIARGQNRILLVMATGTGKTYTAFQIVWRLWKSREKKRILFLADRNALIDQTKRGDFRHFKDKMTIVKKKVIDPSFEIYLALYQGLTNYEGENDAYREFSPDFFDLVIVDECHRGSAAEDSAWREILTYFSAATHIGLTATPRETDEISNIEYFGEPVYVYSLRQGIDDGFLAPYKILRVGLNVDLEGWRPEKDKRDLDGLLVEDRVYNQSDYDRNLIIRERTEAVASRIAEFLRKSNPLSKTIVFCVDIEHAERMRSALVNALPEEVSKNEKYVMRITGDDEEGKLQIDNFINPEETYPVIATTSKLMTTGIDAQTCRLIVLDSVIKSMTEFKQIIGRGTRINEDFGKHYFTIMDFRNVTNLFADPAFDGDPVRVKEIPEGEEIPPDDEPDDEPTTETGTGEDTGTGEGDDSGDEEGEGDTGGGGGGEGRQKVYVAGVVVSILNERRQFLDPDGKLTIETVREYTQKSIRSKYRTLDHFLSDWNSAEKKRAVIEELANEGIPIDELKDEVKKDLDIFDLICHIAWDMPPLTRRERAANVRKRNYFAKYGDKARHILTALLDKYATEGIENIEDPGILRLEPFSSFGTPVQIISMFGGKENYLKAIKELENEIYNTAA